MEQSTQETAAVREDQETRILYGLSLVLAGVLFYALLHSGFRLLVSDVLGEDDVIANVLGQELALGYDTYPRQPPLYNWVLWLVQQWLGPTLESFLLIKYAALTATVGFLYLTARRILGRHVYAVLTVESLALIYSISWRFHEGFTHQVLAMVAVSATVFLFVRLLDHGRWFDYVLFGVVVGLGLLTERVFAAFLAALIVGAMLQPAFRSKVLKPRSLLSLVLAGIIIAPYVGWVLNDNSRVADWYRAGAASNKDYWRGVIDAIRGPFFYLAPLVVIVPIMFPGFMQAAWRKIRQPINRNEPGDPLQLVWHVTVICFVASIVGALVLKLGRQPIHAYMALYITTVIWLFGVVRDSDKSAGQVKRFAVLALAIAAFALSARLANLYVMHPVCKKCRWGMPYVELGEAMKKNGFRDHKIVTYDPELAGNLRQVFANTPISIVGAPAYAPSGSMNTGRVYIWREKDGMSAAERWFRPTWTPDIKAKQSVKLEIPWRHLWRETGYHTTSWRMLRIDDQARARQ
ncbi:MAG: glycosyltransferase family 39 protein [Hyphomicrobiaceae bacterium]